MNGYSVWIDLLFTVFVIGLSAASGTATALVMSAMTGVLLSISLVLLRRILGYTKIERIKGTFFKFQYVNYPPTMFLPKSLNIVSKYLPTVNKVYA